MKYIIIRGLEPEDIAKELNKFTSISTFIIGKIEKGTGVKPFYVLVNTSDHEARENGY